MVNGLSKRLDSMDRTSVAGERLHMISFKVPFNSKILGLFRMSPSLPFPFEVLKNFFPFI